MFVLAVPSITSITGCSPSARSAQAVVECARTGSQLITVRGANFGLAGVRVLIGSSVCGGVTQLATQPHTEVTCLTPSATGVDRPVVLIQGIFLAFSLAISSPLTSIDGSRSGGGGIGVNPNASLSYAECQVCRHSLCFCKCPISSIPTLLFFRSNSCIAGHLHFGSELPAVWLRSVQPYE